MSNRDTGSKLRGSNCNNKTTTEQSQHRVHDHLSQMGDCVPTPQPAHSGLRQPLQNHQHRTTTSAPGPALG
jgi:Ser/Thr protein kinase RdoA (MazF antagonist)